MLINFLHGLFTIKLPLAMYEGQIVPKKVDTFGLFVADIVTDEQKKGILERS